MEKKKIRTKNFVFFSGENSSYSRPSGSKNDMGQHYDKLNRVLQKVVGTLLW